MQRAMKNLLLIPEVVLIAFLSLTEGSCNFEDIRLYDNGEANETKGMLQICDGVKWTAVCDYQWRQEYSVALCNDLGHTNPTPLTVSNNGSWSTISYVAKYTLSSSTPTCYNNNNTIVNCLTNSSSYVTSYYAHYYCNTARDTLYIQCDFDMGTCTSGSIRLYNNRTSSSNSLSGMLQICDNNGRWTAVCGYRWRCSTSKVACKQLGYTGNNVQYKIGSGPWPIFGFGPYSSCSSSYSNLNFCNRYSSFYRQTARYCNPLSTTVYLTCDTTAPKNESCAENYKTRLVNGKDTETSIEGRVEICYRNAWTPFCKYVYGYYSGYYYYYYNSAQIGALLCNSLDDSRVATNLSVLYRDSRFGVSTGIESIAYMRCPGNGLRYCSFTQNFYSCTCPASLGLKCYYRTDCNEGEIRLVNGTIDREGRLEICTNGVWGGFCSSNFRKSAAHVACKQAGYGDVKGAIIYTNGEFGVGDGPVIYGNVECFGHENYIADCSKVVAPNFNCYSYAGVGLLCRDNCSEGSIRLTGGKHSYEGYVEACIDGVWTLVSANGWDDADARVVCKQLKAYGTSAGEAVDNSPYTRSNKAIRFSNVYCIGNEDMLEDCRHHTIELDDGKSYNGPVAAVDCKVTISITNTATLPTQTSTPQTSKARSLKTEDAILGSGVGLLILAIFILVIGISIMGCIMKRMRKLSIARGGRNKEQTIRVQKSLEEEVGYDVVGF
ncbi:PREDICTED: scavenger receptor cysteine-rich domain superfamily protein-like [Amphimedon queenslandica]|uniref:SRCR domain-containing protein n=1 Tax=Amphimedon queenslandica TaxID=400682 RepID=A0AAN0J6U0_AMPQE|nr:PREDICTED: scavenger receptor cysteine-rich domain superfamily protein-like [Amphimedon queenslandica]|eukprot:XP_019852408.1 PREDICTED: scavenger receptor cysteine-rich domain superfamily protein-like [Amphimedon queenslandica]